MPRTIEAVRQAPANGETEFGGGSRYQQSGVYLRTVFRVLATGACYYLATRAAWVLTFPDSKVSLFFPSHAILVSILLLVPTRHWWAYALAAACSHFFAAHQANWPPLYALQSEAFDVVKAVLTAAGIRVFIKSPFQLIGLREAITFVLIAAIVVPFGTAFWGAAFIVSNGYGSDYWVDWYNLGISNAVASIVLVPVILTGVHLVSTKAYRAAPARILEACGLAVGLLVVGYIAFYQRSSGPDTLPPLLYSPVPLLIWATLRFGPAGISASMLVVMTQAIWGTMQGRGPFVAQTPVENALDLQLFLLMVATPLILLAVAVEDERRSKEALRVNEQRMSLAVNSARIALWDWDVASDSIWITDHGRKFFGFAPDEPLHYHSLADRVHPDDRAVRATAIQRALATHSSYEAEYRVVLPDGSVRWISARGHCPANDASQRVVGVSMDITQQKLANVEAQLQREELAHLSRVATVSALSGSIAHELTQPLGSILADASTGQRFMANDAPDLDELRAIFADIVSASRRAADIIKSLRTMLRRGEVVLQPVSVNESIEELLLLIRSDLIGRGVSVSKLTTGDDPLVTTDRVQLQQILLNLIMNACDAMASNRPGDRALTLTTSVVGNEMRIGVLDCGSGLPSDAEALFQPFHGTKSGGLGMGLSICRMLATAQGGRLWAERRAEHGAAFFVALPLVTQEDASTQLPPPPAAANSSFELPASAERLRVVERS